MHIVNTRLQPGYHEIHERMLHAMFSLLQDYVEVGLSSRSHNSKLTDPTLRGLEHLEWEIANCQGNQADAAKVIKDLYIWWTVERPQRLDPWTAVEIWGKTREQKEDDQKKSSFFDFRGFIVKPRPFKLGMKQTPGEQTCGDLSFAAEEFYNSQDTDMMIRLAEIRSSLWT